MIRNVRLPSTTGCFVSRWPYFQRSPEAYLTHMKEYFYFMIEGYAQPFGYMLESKAKQISWPSFWTVDTEKRLVILAHGSGIEQRNAFMAATLQSEHQRGQVSELRKLSKELCAVHTANGEPVLKIDRSAAGLFGIRTYGVFLIAYTNTDQGRKFWVAQRSKNKMTYPGKLDMCVGGSLRADEVPLDCLVREGEEEASIPADISRNGVQPCGVLTYHGQPASRAQTQYVYELELSVTPKPCDDEVEAFKLLSLEEIKGALGRREFKLNIAMTWIDYLVRHGELLAQNEGKYLEICSRLHRNLEFFVV
ncbi:hypothetical protein BU26DRAFT_590150 [Trematosphaeria pertusa]|uniref:Nudix hydrolase domain-containing protein n=1 Tax=Trematosphaeria pertusa TaxID=390896 RepID=A0A6A6IN84_9PLEO|nr:uncharacterized protein BU26DRAFT_590150 [Trematosphaeria pertusa]KAF2251846.1 hypothetical protein BU26DRAFT_590150 [Trematosphaeria pertusa]